MHDPVSLVRWQRDGLAYPDAGDSWWVETAGTDGDADNDILKFFLQLDPADLLIHELLDTGAVFSVDRTA